jgi:guanylate kinase
MKKQGQLIVISAPSGGGKTTLCKVLLKLDPRLVQSISATTRGPRPGEKAGRDYFFISESEFKRRIQSRHFLEWAWVHGHRYGTLKAAVESQLKNGRDVLLTIDVQGGLAVKKQYPKAILIFLLPPSLKVLSRRLRGRGTDSRKTIAERLKNARWELSLADKYDYNVVNDTLVQASREVAAIIIAERLRTRVR